MSMYTCYPASCSVRPANLAIHQLVLIAYYMFPEHPYHPGMFITPSTHIAPLRFMCSHMVPT